MREPSRVGTRGAPSQPVPALTPSQLPPVCSSSSIWGNGKGPLHDPQPCITPQQLCTAPTPHHHLPTPKTYPSQDFLSLLGLPAPKLTHRPKELCLGLPAPCPLPSPKTPLHAPHPCNVVSQPLITTCTPSKLPHTPTIAPHGPQPSLLTLDQRQTSCLGRGSSGGSRFSLLGGRKAAGGRCRAPPAPSGRKNWKELGRPSM